jgi:tRNA-splicing ligase RtcB
MDFSRLKRISEFEWQVNPFGRMRVPVIIFGDQALLEEMDDKVFEQATNVAMLPGIVRASFVMPDGHWGYGFPIGGVASFDPEEGGVISAGGVGFDISCGVRCLKTNLRRSDIEPIKKRLADTLYQHIPAGVGSSGNIRLGPQEMDDMLKRGALWAVHQGYGIADDLTFTEERGHMVGAIPDNVSDRAKKRMRWEIGTLGSGNHYLEVQEVQKIFDPEAAKAFGLEEGQIVVSIHCGSRGLGHQIGTEFLREMAIASKDLGLFLPDQELACAPIQSEIGQRYLGAMRAAINTALANRQIITHLTRGAFNEVIPHSVLNLLYDVSHNTCKVETHDFQELYVHRKGATRAYGPGNSSLPPAYQRVGQPVIIGGTMGTASYILAGDKTSESRSFSSACHGAGRRMSRHQALRLWQGRELVDQLSERGILIRSPSMRGVAEEAPDAYKDVSAVVNSTESAGLARKVAKLIPILCVKG